MSYNKPAVQVYQELLTSGGSTSISPDLPACIVGAANNVVSVDLSDSVSKVRSLAATIPTINDGDVDWVIPVNTLSAFAGQSIDPDTIEVTVSDALIKTFQISGESVSGTSIDLTETTNEVGIVTYNDYNQALPWTTYKNHINQGDAIVLTDTGSGEVIPTVVLSISNDTIEIGANIPASVYDVRVYHKSSETVATVDWDDVQQGIVFGDITGNTFPAGFTAANASTNDGYTFAIENEVKGFGSSASIYIGYIAARNDISSTILTINDTGDLEDLLGEADPVNNPLAFGVSIALANSGGTPVHAIAIDQSAATEVIAHTAALSLSEGQNLYFMVPLTTSIDVQGLYAAHVNAMSLPTSGNWRMTLINQVLPEEYYVLGRPDGGDANEDHIQDGLLECLALDSGFSLSDGVATGVSAGDTVVVQQYMYDAELSEYAVFENEYTVADSAGNVIVTTTTVTEEGQAFVYVKRTASRQEQALAIKAQSETWSNKRVVNFPGEVRVNTSIAGQVVPGYYLMCGVAGLGSGLPAQHGLTNITIAGIAGLEHSNFYFSSDQLNEMAQGGTFLYVQDSQESTPYCRHGLTTDMSVLEYREILKVKNWDYLSYYYQDIISPFIGTWNITPDTIQTIRQSISSASETLLGRKLPKVGPPLLSYKINTLEQDPNSADAIRLDLGVSIVDPNNYTNIYLQV